MKILIIADVKKTSAVEDIWAYLEAHLGREIKIKKVLVGEENHKKIAELENLTNMLELMKREKTAKLRGKPLKTLILTGTKKDGDKKSESW